MSLLKRPDLREAALSGKAEEPVEMVEVVPEVAKTTRTEVATAGERDNWKWRIVDQSIIPREYMVVDNAQLTAIAKRHHDQKTIPGIEFYNEPTMSTRAR